MRFPYIPAALSLLGASLYLSPSPALADATVPPHKVEDALTIQAENFSQQDAIGILDKDDGAKIGVLVNTDTAGERIAKATWSFRTIEAGTYLLEFRYAAAEESAGTLRLNNTIVSQSSMGLSTGGGNPRKQSWVVQGVFEFKKGINHLAFEKQGPWARLDQIRLTRRDGALQLTKEEYTKRCGKDSSCEQGAGRTCSLVSGTLGPAVTKEEYTKVQRPPSGQYCGIDTHYNTPRKCGFGSQIDTAVANSKDHYDLCGLVRVNRDFCLTERFQAHRFSSLSTHAGKTGKDICDEMLGKLRDANIFLLYR